MHTAVKENEAPNLRTRVLNGLELIGHPVTTRELAEAIGITVSQAATSVSDLKARGLVVKKGKKANVNGQKVGLFMLKPSPGGNRVPVKRRRAPKPKRKIETPLAEAKSIVIKHAGLSVRLSLSDDELTIEF